ncbi:MAG: hypothetical protein IK136_02840 [Oscillospiraceae bacterium]|nr:hypothetical protein [Oscillospiraceae bacterium]
MDHNSRATTMGAICPHCGARLTVHTGQDRVICDYCGMPFPLEKPADRYRDAPCEAAAPAAEAPAMPPQPRKRHTLLWVLGWIFIFPVPLTILMLRNRTLPAWARYGVIAAGWIVYLLIAIKPGGGDRQTAEPEYRAPAVTEKAPEPSASPQISTKPKPAAVPASAESPSPKPAEKAEAEAPSPEAGVTPSFKKAMDSYEAFFDEYTAFMKSFSDDPSDMTALMRYADIMSRYADVTEKLEAIDESSLSPADLAYYTEVMARIDAKLLKAAAYMQ